MLALLNIPASAAPSNRCAITIAPRVALPPVQYARARVTIDDDSRAALVIIDGEGFYTSSEFEVRERTRWIEFRGIRLMQGEYAVGLRTSSGCTARDSIIVGGADF